MKAQTTHPMHLGFVAERPGVEVHLHSPSPRRLVVSAPAFLPDDVRLIVYVNTCAIAPTPLQ